jgi:hypothetical protein
MESKLYPLLLVEQQERILTWRFETEDDALRARVLARMNKVPFRERWGVLPSNTAFTRRSEYETTLKALGRK